MKILVLADEESKLLYDHFKPGMLDDIELILACGDLHASYLSFLVTMSHATVLYIHGNHDHYEKDAMNGCICVESASRLWLDTTVGELHDLVRSYNPAVF